MKGSVSIIDPVSSSWLPRWMLVVASLIALAAAAVQSALLPVLYSVPVPVAMVVAVGHAGSIPMALRRPSLGAALAVGGTAVTAVISHNGAGRWPWPVPVVTLIVLSIAVFALAQVCIWPVSVVTASAAVLVAAVVAIGYSMIFRRPVASANLLLCASVLILVLVFAMLVRQWTTSRRQVAESQARAEAELDRRRLLEERTRIARELHDVVAHTLSIISIQASTLRYRVPGVSREVDSELDEISESAREALEEMRGLLHVLRAEDSAGLRAPQPVISQIPELVDSTRRSGRTVRFEVVGDVEEPVSEATSLAAYRIVQEALSNAVRHAPGSDIDVALTISDQLVAIVVSNAAPDHVDTGGGLGLRGMRERAAVAGGSVQAGRENGHFVVRAELRVRRTSPQSESNR